MPEQQWTPQIRRVNPNEQEWLQFAGSLLREKRIDEARDELLGILQQNERSVAAHLMLAALYQGQRMFTEALGHCRYALAIDPMNAAAHQRAGACCLRLNEFDEARGLLQTALDLDPKNIGAHVGMAQLLARTGEVEGAIAHLEEALRLDPQMVPARLLMARLLSRSGKVEEAIEELDGFHHANPSHIGAAVGLARAEGQRGNSGRAGELLEAATKANPDAGNVWMMLGRVKMNVEDFAGAETAFREALRLQAPNGSAQLQLVAALVPQGKFAEASELLGKVPRRGPRTRRVHQLYGDLYAAQKIYGEALESYRAALLHSENGQAVLEELERSFGPAPDQQVAVSRYQAACAAQQEEMRNRRREQNPGGQGFARFARRRAGGPDSGMSRLTRP